MKKSLAFLLLSFAVIASSCSKKSTPVDPPSVRVTVSHIIDLPFATTMKESPEFQVGDTFRVKTYYYLGGQQQLASIKVSYLDGTSFLPLLTTTYPSGAGVSSASEACTDGCDAWFKTWVSTDVIIPAAWLNKKIGMLVTVDGTVYSGQDGIDLAFTVIP